MVHVEPHPPITCSKVASSGFWGLNMATNKLMSREGGGDPPSPSPSPRVKPCVAAHSDYYTNVPTLAAHSSGTVLL